MIREIAIRARRDVPQRQVCIVKTMEKDPSELPGMPRNPWRLKTPDGKTDFKAFRAPSANPPAIVVRVGTKELRYHLRCLDDLYEMLKANGDWVPLGGAAEHVQVGAGSVEAWARSPHNPVGGWYGLEKGSRGDFAVYVPPIMKTLNLAEMDDAAGECRMKAVL